MAAIASVAAPAAAASAAADVAVAAPSDLTALAAVAVSLSPTETVAADDDSSDTDVDEGVYTAPAVAAAAPAVSSPAPRVVTFDPMVHFYRAPTVLLLPSTWTPAMWVNLRDLSADVKAGPEFRRLIVKVFIETIVLGEWCQQYSQQTGIPLSNAPRTASVCERCAKEGRTCASVGSECLYSLLFATKSAPAKPKTPSKKRKVDDGTTSKEETPTTSEPAANNNGASVDGSPVKKKQKVVKAPIVVRKPVAQRIVAVDNRFAETMAGADTPNELAQLIADYALETCGDAQCTGSRPGASEWKKCECSDGVIRCRDCHLFHERTAVHEKKMKAVKHDAGQPARDAKRVQRYNALTGTKFTTLAEVNVHRAEKVKQKRVAAAAAAKVKRADDKKRVAAAAALALANPPPTVDFAEADTDVDEDGDAPIC